MQATLVTLVFLFCFSAAEYSWGGDLDLEIGNGGWDPSYDPWIYTDICTIDRVGILTEEEFNNHYLQQRPVIFDSVEDNSIIISHTEKGYMLDNYGDVIMMLSSANTFSYKRDYITLHEYIEENITPHDISTPGDKTFYLFGGNHHILETQLFPKYKRPPFANSNTVGSISFGIAGSGSGVPLHRHGHVFAEVFYGQKRWFLYPPEDNPFFDPDASTLQWFHSEYPKLQEHKKPQECVLKPGQVLYIPDWWWHATLNIGETVFISTFV